MDRIPGFEAWETQSGVFFLHYVVIVHFHTLPIDPTQDIFVLFMRQKQVLGIVL
jgi:hypothetical protein